MQEILNEPSANSSSSAHCPSTVESSDVALDPKVRAANLGVA